MSDNIAFRIVFSFFFFGLISVSSNSSFGEDYHLANQTCPLNALKSEVRPFWAGSEHIYLGDLGGQAACTQAGLSPCPLIKMPRADHNTTYSYGEVVALGDLVENPDEIYLDKSDKASNERLETVFACMSKQGRVFRKQKEVPKVELPGCGWVIAVNTKKGLKLLLNNYSHFAWYNMMTYTAYHQEALLVAQQGFEFNKNGKPQMAEERLYYALFLNAFADHFLTDAFAAGHVRVPRLQVKKWTEKNLRGILKSIRGDLMGLALHDSDGKNYQNEEVGLPVENSLGNHWVTHSDGKLNECTGDEEPGIAFPVSAVQRSVNEIFRSYFRGEMPSGIFAATEVVPFPAAASLVDKYFPGGDKNSSSVAAIAKWLRESLVFPLRIILSQNDTVNILAGLPEILNEFQTAIRNDLAEKGTLTSRLPPRYIGAMTTTR